jgi:hypothetical protein
VNKFEALLELAATGSNLAALLKHKGFGEAMREVPKVLKEDGPNLFDFGFDGKSLWFDACRKAEQSHPGTFTKITALLRVMNQHEDYCLRMVITNMKLPYSKRDGDSAIQPTLDSDRDPRVQALVFIAKLFKETADYKQVAIDSMDLGALIQHAKEIMDLPESHGLVAEAKLVREMLRDHNMIKGQNEFVAIWQKLVKRIDQLLELGGIKSIKQLETPEGRGEIVRKLRAKNDAFEKEQREKAGKQGEDRESVVFWFLGFILRSSRPNFSETMEIAWFKRFFNDEPKRNSESRRRDLSRMRP